MHIGIDLRLHAYAPGGISRYARHLARALSAQLTAETLTLVQHRRESDPVAVPGARVYAAWTPPHHRLERWGLGLELLPLKLDVFHSTDFIPPAWGARHTVITVHDLNFLYYPQYLTADARRYYNDQIAWAVARADAILADSYATRRDLERLLHVDPARVTVTHLAADAHFRPLPPEETRAVLARYGLEPGYLLFVGTWEPRKNLPGLLEALAQLHARGEKRVLVIAGRPGWLYDEIFTRVQTLRLEPWVRFIEQVPGTDLVALYNGALLLAMPSFYEGFGLPALEALQCGTPVVVADRASLPEVVGLAGLLIDPDDPTTIADACWRIAHDAELRARLQAEGQEQVRTFTWEETARRTLEVYRRVCGNASTAIPNP
ncbi:MAG TPA: glycosyltransferase family 1 protein [Anaerolineae bacterium]|nr:glycosyltransferase family 1 protein [Anaerolineae bacterium]HQK13348.1 glycosyltransferase family 1 protein [Anaerolineae bacterium]